jgi:hypothetical protein
MRYSIIFSLGDLVQEIVPDLRYFSWIIITKIQVLSYVINAHRK